MIRHLAERFSGHELPPPEGAWEAISSQLTLSAAASADGVNELFRERFAEHSVHVPPSVWTNVSGQLGYGAASGWGAVAAWAGAGVAALVLTGTLVWVTHEPASTSNTQSGLPAIEQTATPTTQPASVPATTQEPTIKVDESRTAVLHNTEPAVVPDHATKSVVAPDLIAEIKHEMQEKASQEPLMPVESTTDPRLAEEHQPIVSPSEEVKNEPVHDKKPDPTPADPDHHAPEEPDGTTIEPPLPEPEVLKPFTLVLPNAFTPNGDGVNDLYLPEGVGHAGVKIRVYSMTNNQQLVFSADEKRGWDGTYFNGGQACPEGTYLVAVEVIDENGKAHAQGTVVNLLR